MAESKKMVKKKTTLASDEDVYQTLKLVSVYLNRDMTEIRTEDDTINYEHNNPEQYPVDNILENIKKLYGIYVYGKNEKLIEGAREEILKLIALLIWNIFY